MVVRSFALVATLVAVSSVSHAVVQPAHLAGRPQLEVAGGTPARIQPTFVVDQVPRRAARAWLALIADTGRGWHASWDAATGVPSRMWGPGVSVPGAVNSPDVAARFARAFLDRHLDLLAPGSSAADFVLVADHLDRGMRTIGFAQHHAGLPVLGGQVSFRFKNDRMFLVGSEALPLIQAAPARRIDDARARRLATDWIGGTAGAVTGPVILPIIGNGRVLAYHTVVRVVVDVKKPIGRWDTYLDAATGKPVARRQTLMFASATLRYDTPDRHPLASRTARVAQRATLTGNTVSATTDDDGVFTWTAGGSATITASLTGPRVTVINDAGAAATAMFTVPDGGSQTWDATADQLIDAQLSAFVHGRIVKEYARSFAPGLAWLDGQLVATVNIDDECNAFSDGDTINFFRSSSECANTALTTDVVYHEAGHSIHAQSIIDGVGSFDSAFSEGLSDYLAATMQNDSGMGRGFFHDNTALRELDPVGSEFSWPQDIGEVHTTGKIFGGAMWDLRKALIEQYGQDEGVRRADQMFYAAVQRASSIPATYFEILAFDDDNGDLTDGTPHGCLVDATFGPHGLRAISYQMTPLSTEPPRAEGHTVTVDVVTVIPACPGDDLTMATIDWSVRGQSGTGGTVEMEGEMVGLEGQYTGVIPDQPDGTVVNYQVELAFGAGTTISFPDNPADPLYEFYVGNVEVIYCNDFDGDDPFAGEWFHSLDAGSAQEGADDWTWGTPAGVPGSGDPPGAYSGANAIGNDLGGGDYNGMYQPDKTNSATSPIIPVGAYSDVRLHYRRWLNVEDGFFDRATIYVNDEVAWENLNTDQGNASTTHHTDREWRFHDVPLSDFINDGQVQVKFEIASDGGLEFGGWTVDDFCVIALAGSICGDGAVSATEECDEGGANSDTDPDACRADCRAAFCGDGVVDADETCDDGENQGTGQGTCPSACVEVEQGGCCSTGRGGAGHLAGLVLLIGLVAFRLRKR
jgi:hypothetical protein